jgi:hypothetical protein
VQPFESAPQALDQVAPAFEQPHSFEQQLSPDQAFQAEFGQILDTMPNQPNVTEAEQSFTPAPQAEQEQVEQALTDMAIDDILAPEGGPDPSGETFDAQPQVEFQPEAETQLSAGLQPEPQVQPQAEAQLQAQVPVQSQSQAQSSTQTSEKPAGQDFFDEDSRKLEMPPKKGFFSRFFKK